MVGEEMDANTSLRCAALEGNLERVRMLVEQGADVHTCNLQKNTSLHMATLHGHESVVAFLLKYGANPDTTNVTGQTSLHLACTKGHLSIVRLITQHGCDLHAQNGPSGMTGLHYASRAGHAQICQHLLDVGAEEEITDTIDKIAEFYAANHPTELVFRKRKGQSGKGKKKQAAQPQATKPQATRPSATKTITETNKDPPKSPVVTKDQNKIPDKKTEPKAVKSETLPQKSYTKPKEELNDLILTKSDITVEIEEAKNAKSSGQTKVQSNSNASETNAKATSIPSEENTKNDSAESKPPATTNQAAQTKIQMDNRTNKQQATSVSTPDRPVAMSQSNQTNEQQTNSETNKQASKQTAKTETTPTASKMAPEKPEADVGQAKQNKATKPDNQSLKSKSRDSWNRDPQKYSHTPGGGNVKIEGQKLDWNAESSGYGQGAIKRNNVTKAKDKEFEWSDDFKKRQQQSVFDRLMGGGGGAKARARDRSPTKSSNAK